jgi:hypothetical protein
MKWEAFEGSVLAADLCDLDGCERCPGFTTVQDLPAGRMRTTGEAPDPDATVFCSHSCHQVPKEELENLESGQPVTFTCPHCGATQTFPGGFFEIEMFVCQSCGKKVEIGVGPVQ